MKTTTRPIVILLASLSICGSTIVWGGGSAFADKIEDIIFGFKKQMMEEEDLIRRVPIICTTRQESSSDGIAYTVSMTKDECLSFRKQLAADPDMANAIRRLYDAGIKIFVLPKYGSSFGSTKLDQQITKTRDGHFVMTNGISIFLVKDYFGLRK